jgi:dihydrodipicolinate synthase/N-acetylneuraminate lyase
MYEHFSTILSQIDIPVMIQDAEDFNGIHIDPSLYVKLAIEHSNFVSVKIEGGNTLQKIRQAKSLVHDQISILGGMGGREVDFGRARARDSRKHSQLLSY